MSRDRYSLTRLVSTLGAGLFYDNPRLPEYEAHVRMCADAARPLSLAQYAARIPPEALFSGRDMTSAGQSGSSYLVGTELQSYVAALTPASVALQLGAQTLRAKGDVIVPRGSAAIAAGWTPDENAPLPETQPTVAQIGAKPKTVGAVVEISRQLLLQSDAEEAVRRELRNAVGAALDAAMLAGRGYAGEPQGIIGTPGVGAFTGASLGWPAIINAESDVTTANAVVDRNALGWAAHPGVAELLKARYRVAGGERPIWEGHVAAGSIDDRPALSTTGMPAASLIHGDWTGVTIIEWTGGAEIAVNAFSPKSSVFAEGKLQVRVLLTCDVILTRPASFTVATGVN